jgi:hypothetical protein
LIYAGVSMHWRMPAMLRACRLLSSTLVALTAIAAAWPRSAASQPTIPPIVERASAYVDEFVQHFSNVVAEERYVQETIAPKRRRALLSDFLLVTPPGSRDWYQFRDVLEVDGKAVREHDDRLTKLFLESPRNALERAREVVDSGRRYHLADIGGMDVPLLGIGFLQSYYAPRFAYTVGAIERKLGPSVRVVKFDEWQRPTILRFGANSDYSSHGLFYIDEPTGRVLRTEVDLERRTLPLQVVTDFKFDDTLQAIVPVEMRTPLGTATYGRFRRFGVQTDEKIR